MSSDTQAPDSWRGRLTAAVSRWLSVDVRPRGMPRNDFARLCEHLKPADIVLVEGRSRVAGVIQSVTLSSWTHAALYIGRVSDFSEELIASQPRVAGLSGDTPLLLEAEIEEGVHLSPVRRYASEHLRLCRPSELSQADAPRVVAYALDRLGTPYDLRHIADLLRFFFPYGLMPRHWRSTLFEAGHGDIARTICSSLLANAFASVRYPILPILHRGPDGGVVFHRRNTRLVTPRDFDYSPYFDIVKYPFFGDDVARYRELDWQDERFSSSSVSG